MRKTAAVLLGGVLAAVLAASVWSQPAQSAETSRPCPYAAPPRPVGPKLHPLGTLTIGSIGLKTPIFMGDWPDMDSEASKTLMYGPAFYSQTKMLWANSLPGQGGTVGMAGHRTTRTHPNCLIADIPIGAFAVVKMSYGTFTYREVANVKLPGNSDEVFFHPAKYDPHPRAWAPGIRPEYLVDGACDPPHSATSRRNAIFKLVRQSG